MLKEVMKILGSNAYNGVRIFEEEQGYLVMFCRSTTQYTKSEFKENIVEILRYIKDNDARAYANIDSDIETYLKDGITVLVVKGEYNKAINALNTMKKIEFCPNCGSIDKVKTKEYYCLATIKEKLLVYKESELDEVMYHNGFVAPVVIETFDNESAAYARLCELSHYTEEKIREIANEKRTRTKNHKRTRTY